MAFSPIFIIGVPRSGTTLLRVLLDSHSQILALPETPWVSGAYGGQVSLRHLLEDLTDGPYGIARNVAGVEREHVRLAGAAFLEQLFQPALKARNKSVIAFKTPSDIPYLDFLTGLLPDALYIHITRDGRDVAMSQLAKKGSFFLDLRGYRGLSYANVFRRWVEWETRARTALHGGQLRVIHMRYEDLIADPEREMRRVLDFLGLPFEPRMLDYASQSHDYPRWEAGSSDVARHRGLTSASVGKWRGQKHSLEMQHTLLQHDRFLVDLGYPSSGLAPGPARRMLLAGYAAIRPAIEMASLARRRLWPLLRNKWRVLACVCLLLLAVQFLAPVRLLAGLGSDALGPLFCLGATLCFAAAFVPALQRLSGSNSGLTLLRSWALITAFVAVLEAAQALTPDRHAALQDFAWNASAVLAALLAAMTFLQRLPRARPA